MSEARLSPKPARQSGFTLLELLIAMTLGLLVLGGILTVYIASSHSYRVAENSSRLQEGARFAFEKIGENVRMTGHLGCFGDIASLNSIATPPAANLTDAETAMGINLTATTVVTGQDTITAAAFTGGSVAGTDAVTLRKASAASIGLYSSMANASATIPLYSNTIGLRANDLVVISDCISADLVCGQSTKFAISVAPTLATAGNSPCAGNSSTSLSKAYSADAQVMKLEETTFYIRNNVAGQPALFWQKRSGSATATEEIVEGVQDMQLCYGEDTSGNSAANVYRTANNVGNWGNVVSVRVSLLMRSTENGVAAAAQAFAIDRNCDGDTADAGEAVPPTDLRLRRVFTSTFGIRNRLP